MEEKFIKKVFGITLLVYFASICLVYLVSSKQFHYQETQSDTVSQSQVVGEFAEGDTIKQTFTVDSQYLEGVRLKRRLQMQTEKILLILMWICQS